MDILQNKRRRDPERVMYSNVNILHKTCCQTEENVV